MIVWDRELYHSWGNSPKQKSREKQYNAEYYKKHRAKILADRKKNAQRSAELDRREASLSQREKAFEQQTSITVKRQKEIEKQRKIEEARRKKAERKRKKLEKLRKERMQRIRERNFNRAHQVLRVYGSTGRLIGLKKLSKSKPKRKS